MIRGLLNKMKVSDLIRTLLIFVFNPLLCSCSDSFPFDVKAEGPHLNICVLGNSYSNDAFSYVPFILREYGITCNLHIYYRGSLSLHDLDEQWYDDSAYGLADLDNGMHNRFHFSIDTRKEKKWSKSGIVSAHELVSMRDWDIITLQQGGNRAKREESYYPYLQNIIDKIKVDCQSDYALTWFMAYNGGRDNDNLKSLETQAIITESFPFSMVLPVATAVFTCQEDPVFSELGSSQYKKMYASDNIHLQEGIPCYVAALTIVQVLLDRYMPGKTVLDSRIRPTQEWIESIGGITPNGTSTGVTEDNCARAQRIAKNATEHPFEIIPLQ